MKTTNVTAPTQPHEPWYKYGVAVLILEMAIALGVSAWSLYLTFHGLGALPGKH